MKEEGALGVYGKIIGCGRRDFIPHTTVLNLLCAAAADNSRTAKAVVHYSVLP